MGCGNSSIALTIYLDLFIIHLNVGKFDNSFQVIQDTDARCGSGMKSRQALSNKQMSTG